VRWSALQWVGLLIVAAGFGLLEPWAGVVVLGVGLVVAGVVGELGVIKRGSR
jgi:hypothetical protein